MTPGGGDVGGAGSGAAGATGSGAAGAGDGSRAVGSAGRSSGTTLLTFQPSTAISKVVSTLEPSL
jgi:hypothetical protein